MPVEPRDSTSITALGDQFKDEAGRLRGRRAPTRRSAACSDCLELPQRHRAWRSPSLALVAAIVLILNTIRMAMFARRREIEVMKLVGATQLVHPRPVHARGPDPGAGRQPQRGRLDLHLQLACSPTSSSEEGVGLLSDFVVPTSHLGPLSFILVLAGVAVAVLCSGVAASRYLDV